MSGPAGNLESQEEMKKIEKLRDVQKVSDLSAVLGTGPGRRVMYRVVFEVAGAESLSYTGVNEGTNFREGRRDVGLTLMREMQELVPELYLLMLSEAVTEAAELTRKMKRIKEAAHGGSDGPDDQ
jgi:hypothetical protein